MQNVGNPKSTSEGVGGGGLAEVVREDTLADYARDSTEQDSRGDEARASDRYRLGGSFGGAGVDGSIMRYLDRIERLFFGLNGYGSDS